MGKLKTKKSFTLLELIIVIVILGILVTIGFTQYSKMTERGRASEARMILSQLRTAAIGYHQEHAQWPGSLTDLAVSVADNVCDPKHHFKYVSLGNIGTATRCKTGGKSAGDNDYVLTLNYETGSLNTGGY